MDVLSLPDLKELSGHTDGPLVSIYMQTQPFGPDSQLENVGRLKNLLKSASAQLAEMGLRPAEVEAVLDPVRRLSDDRPFWLRAEAGLAIFADGGVRVFRLPEAPPETVVVGSRYHLRPLLALLGSDRHFYLLALSQKRARLLRGSVTGLTEIDLGDAPSSLAEALRWDDFEKRSLQYHSATNGTSGGRRSPVFHGSGEPDPKDEIMRYFREIDRALVEQVKDGAPLILAGVDYVLPLYREVNSYPALYTQAIVGSPDSLGDEALHEQSAAIAAEAFSAEQRQAAERIDALWATPRATSDPETFVLAAIHGRVEALFISNEATLWGTVDEAADSVELHTLQQPTDEDLLDLAALRTILAGGSVFPLPAAHMPRDAAAVALLRY
ncbi:MAG: hypothetical protein D9V44_08735 [Actinobacteria bacterium]|nr:MAG: hypothetical protein D9V44_08735 [Actinomycetota bacterium]